MVKETRNIYCWGWKSNYLLCTINLWIENKQITAVEACMSLTTVVFHIDDFHMSNQHRVCQMHLPPGLEIMACGRWRSIHSVAIHCSTSLPILKRATLCGWAGEGEVCMTYKDIIVVNPCSKWVSGLVKLPLKLWYERAITPQRNYCNKLWNHNNLSNDIVARWGMANLVACYKVPASFYKLYTNRSINSEIVQFWQSIDRENDLFVVITEITILFCEIKIEVTKTTPKVDVDMNEFAI